jgi:hypothetical protein
VAHTLNLPQLGKREALLAARAADNTCKTGVIIPAVHVLASGKIKALYHATYRILNTRCRAYESSRAGSTQAIGDFIRAHCPPVGAASLFDDRCVRFAAPA